MKTIGLIGGMSWESSIEYYRIINEITQAKLGGLHSAKSVMYSVDFSEIEALQHQQNWEAAGHALSMAAQSVEKAGADFIVLCTNTMHKVADQIQANIQIPLLHIVDATAREIHARGLETIGLLGTRFTMEEDFFKRPLKTKYDLNVIVPAVREREVVHRVIFDELCVGAIRQTSKAQVLAIIERLAESGAEGIILGCTEIGLLIHDKDIAIPLFDTTRIHARAAVDYALDPSAGRNPSP